jgi:hypothetical protein
VIVAALMLTAVTPVTGLAEQVWSRCLYDRLLTRLRFEDENDLASEPAALTFWAFVECGVEFDKFARGMSPSTIKKAVRRERRGLGNLVKLDQHGRTLREI